jgi:hypothetical protein
MPADRPAGERRNPDREQRCAPQRAGRNRIVVGDQAVGDATQQRANAERRKESYPPCSRAPAGRRAPMEPGRKRRAFNRETEVGQRDIRLRQRHGAALAVPVVSRRN